MSKTNTYIKIRTEFEGYHFYPGAGKIDSKIKFLENEHRHMFKVEVKISVTHTDRELEFFLVKWALQNFIKTGNHNHKSCEMIATDILENHLLPTYGERYYEVVVSEDGESDGIIEFQP
jgi:6-pyruvoyl-tetrahydropterin synthase